MKKSMANNFPAQVQEIVGPHLSRLGFVLDGIDGDVDEGGRRGSVVFYRREDCKLQIYWSTREFEINCMIAPPDAPNEHGLYDRSTKWHYLGEFIEAPELPLEELVRVLSEERSNFDTHPSWLEWIGKRIDRDFETARAGVCRLYG